MHAKLLGSAHIGEVQASVWDAATREACAKQQASLPSCKQVFHTKIQRQDTTLMVPPLPLPFFACIRGEIVRVLYRLLNKKSPDECLRIFCGELGTAPLRGQRDACAGDDSHLAENEISIQFHKVSAPVIAVADPWFATLSMASSSFMPLATVTSRRQARTA